MIFPSFSKCIKQCLLEKILNLWIKSFHFKARNKTNELTKIAHTKRINELDIARIEDLLKLFT